MSRARLLAAAGLASLVVLLSATLPSGAASGPAFLTTSAVETAASVRTIGGYVGVMVNYTSTFNPEVTGFVFIDLTNSAGQTVYWNLGSCGFVSGGTDQCFVVISPTVASGSYTAHVFATTSTGVAISSSATLKVTV